MYQPHVSLIQYRVRYSNIRAPRNGYQSGMEYSLVAEDILIRLSANLSLSQMIFSFVTIPPCSFAMEEIHNRLLSVSMPSMI